MDFSVKSLVSVAILFVCAVYVSCAFKHCKQGKNCLLPNCSCPTFEHPLGSENIPQIVYFGFDDAVQLRVSEMYNKLFTVNRTNPNGCPITMSLYVSDGYTDYSLVRDFNSFGDEIGVHSVNHKDCTTKEELIKQATDEKNNIIYYAGVSGDQIKGWRSPDLKTVGNLEPDILKELDYEYDISLTYYEDMRYPFPFTLDYGYPYKCAIPPCPSKNSAHPGFWEVMVRSMFDPVTKEPCVYVDACHPKGEKAAYDYLWYNFEHNYKRGRAPFGLNMHAAWFYTDDYIKAMGKFIDDILQLGDVYIVSASQMLQWMKSPVNKEEAKDFEPFGCYFEKNKIATKSKAEATSNKIRTGSIQMSLEGVKPNYRLLEKILRRQNPIHKSEDFLKQWTRKLEDGSYMKQLRDEFQQQNN